MGLPLVVSDYRQKKILKRFQVTPVTPVLILAVLQNIADVLPLTQGIKLLKATSLGLPIESVLFPTIVMIVLATICVGILIRFFRWE